LIYIIEDDQDLEKILYNHGGTGSKLAENAVTPEGYIQLITHFKQLDEEQVYAIQPARRYLIDRYDEV
jgi:hypothetical protein